MTTQNLKRKKINNHLADRKRTRPSKDSAIIKPLSDKQTSKRAEEALHKVHEELEMRVQERTAELGRANEAMRGEITDRKRAEEALREGERFLSSIFSSIQDGISILDNEFNILRVNPALEQWYSHAMPLIGKKCYEAYHGRGERCDVCPTYQTINTGKGVYEVVPKTGASGEIVGWLDLYSFPLIDTVTGKMRGVIEYVRDITKRKQAEEALRQSEEKYRTILENIQDGYFEVNLAGNCTFANDARCRSLGYTKEELMGMNNQQFTDKENGKKVYQAFNRVYRTGEPVNRLEEEVIRKDGTKAFSEISISLIRNSEGKPIGFRGISRDITERKQAEEALKASEANYRAIFNAANDAIFIHNMETGEILGVNRKMCEMYGYTVEEARRINVGVLSSGKPPYTQEDALRWIKKAVEGYPQLFEWMAKDKAGRLFWVEVNLKRVTIGGEDRLLAIVRDITERKKAEEAMTRSEERYRTLVEESFDGIFIQKGPKIIFANQRLYAMLGYDKGELEGLNHWLVYHPDYWEITRGRAQARMRGETVPSRYEVKLQHKDGSSFYGEVNARAIMFDKEPGIQVWVRDITERKQAEDALRESEERYRTILENIEDGYYEVDLPGNLTFFNDSLCRMLGYSRDEMIGMGNQQYTDEENRKKLFQAFNEVYRTGESTKGFAWKVFRKDGKELFGEVSVSLVKDSKGQPIGFRGIARDITERKRAEKEMAALQEQFRQSQKMEAVGRLGGGIAHDFNNLLTIIKGYSQLSLLDLKENDPLWGNIQEIQKATQRATDLTRQLLAFSRRQILDLKVLDLNTLLKDLDKMLRRIIGEDIELVTLLSEDLERVKIDPGQFEQMILNLAVNARDAMPSGGKLTIETANVVLDEEYARTHVSVTPGSYVQLSVSDTGIGIPLEVKEKVFEPFFTTKEKGKGTGLGLSTVYGIVKQSGGNIWVYSEPSHGTTFKIYLPRVEEELDILHGQDESDFLPKGSETVLLVEDEPSVRGLAYRVLCQQGYTVLEAVNGEEALRMSQEHIGEKIHLLLTDVVMPQMGGKELADQLKILRPDIKVLYASGYTDNAIVHHGVLNPGTHFLQKPFSLKTLSHKVREVLDREGN